MGFAADHVVPTLPDVIDGADLPPCVCDHDFYDGTGINFHFYPRCPKGSQIFAMEQFMYTLREALGDMHLTVVETDRGVMRLRRKLA